VKTQLNRELEIFAAAVALPQTERAAYLQSACAGDEKLREQVQALLDAHSDAGTFMQSPPAPVARDGLLADEAAGLIVVTEKAGDRIGRYKLLQQIGEGGMGVVYMAEQEEPVRRRVALKIIKLGMDTRQVVARFEAERQALASWIIRTSPKFSTADARTGDFSVAQTSIRKTATEMSPLRAVHTSSWNWSKASNSRSSATNTSSPPANASNCSSHLPGDPARASKGNHPPRHQAVEHPRHHQRRRGRAQGD
jgi:hypothetical protein